MPGIVVPAIFLVFRSSEAKDSAPLLRIPGFFLVSHMHSPLGLSFRVDPSVDAWSMAKIPQMCRRFVGVFPFFLK